MSSIRISRFVAPTPRPADQQGCRCLYELMVCSSDTSELLPLPASPRVLIREASEARLTLFMGFKGHFHSLYPKAARNRLQCSSFSTSWVPGTSRLAHLTPILSSQQRCCGGHISILLHRMNVQPLWQKRRPAGKIPS